jgi:hypothetical protein
MNIILTGGNFAGGVDLSIFDRGYASCWPSDVKSESAGTRIIRQPHYLRIGGFIEKLAEHAKEIFSRLEMCFKASELGRNTIRERQWENPTFTRILTTDC